MGLTFIAAAEVAGDGTSSATIDCTSALNVQAGDLLIAWAKHEGANTTFAVAKTTGSPANNFTFDAGDEENHSNGDLNGAFGYVLSAAADSSATFRLTLGASRPWKALIVMQFRPDSGETVTREAGNNASGTGTSLNSGNISPSGSDLVVLGGFAQYNNVTTSAHNINGVAADAVEFASTSDFCTWYRLLSAGFTNGAATMTQDLTEAYIIAVVAFKSESSGSELFKEVSDSISLSDATLKDLSKVLADAVALADLIAKSVSKAALVESIELADAISKEAQLSKLESFAVADALVRDTGKAVADSVSVADVVAKAVTQAALIDAFELDDTLATAIVILLEISDSISLADAKSMQVQLAKVESISLAEVLAKHVSPAAFVDSLNLDDSVAAALVLVLELADSLSLSDAGTRTLGKVITDTLTLADQVFKHIAATRTDTISLADVVQAVRQLNAAFSDNISLGDSSVAEILIISAVWKLYRQSKATSRPVIPKQSSNPKLIQE